MPKSLKHTDLLSPEVQARVLADFKKLFSSIQSEFDKFQAVIKEKQANISAKDISSTTIKEQRELSKLIKIQKERFNQLNQLKTIENQFAAASNNAASATRNLSAEEKLQLQIEKQLANERIKQTTTIRNLSAQLVQAKEKTKQLNIETQKGLGIYKSTSNSLKNLAQSIKGYIGASLGIYAVVSVFKNIFETAKKLDSLRFTLQAIITDSNELANTQYYLTDISNRYGQELLSLTDNFVRFKAAIKSSNMTVAEGNKIFESFTKVGAVLGKSTADMDLIFLALEQMISKGTVASEELRRQLGERIPGAVAIMAKAVGVSTKKLGEMLKAGKVMTEDVLPKFAIEMEKTFGTTSLNEVNNLNAATNRLKNSWIQLVDAVTTDNKVVFTGITNLLASSLQGLTDVVSLLTNTKYERLLKTFYETTGAEAVEFIEDMTNSSEDFIRINEEKINQLIKENTELSKIANNTELSTKKQKEAAEQIDVNKESMRLLNEQLNYYNKTQIKGLEGEDKIKAIEAKIKELRIAAELADEGIKRAESNKEGMSAKQKIIAAHDFLGVGEDAKYIKKQNEDIDNYLKTKAWSNSYADNLEIMLTDAKKKMEVHTDDVVEILGIIGRLQKQIKETNEAIVNAGSQEEIIANKKKLENLENLLNYYNDLTDSTDGYINALNRYETIEKAIIALEKLDPSDKRIEAWRDEKDALELYIIQLDNVEGRLVALQAISGKIDNKLPKTLDSDMSDVAVSLMKLENDLTSANSRLLSSVSKKGREQLLKDIKEIEREIAKAKGEIQYSLEDKILLHLGVSEDDLDKTKEAIADLVDSLSDLSNAWTDYEVMEAEQRIELYDNEIQDLESKLETEKKLKDEGAENDYDRELARLSGLNKLREDAVEKSKKAQKRQAAIDLALEQSAIALTIANIFKENSKLGAFGWIAAIAASASAMASIMSYRNKVKSIDNEYDDYKEDGGWVKGRSHREGGTRLLAEKDEYVTNKKSAKKSPKLLEAINAGKIDDRMMSYMLNFPNIDFNQKFDDRPVQILNSIDRTNKRLYERSLNSVQVIDNGNNELLLIYDKNHIETVKRVKH